MHITYPIASAAYSHFPVLVLDEGMRSIVNWCKRSMLGLSLVPNGQHRSFRDRIQGTLSLTSTNKQWCCRQAWFSAYKQRPCRIVQCFGNVVERRLTLRRLQT